MSFEEYSKVKCSKWKKPMCLWMSRYDFLNDSVYQWLAKMLCFYLNFRYIQRKSMV